jgi:hypothetical protein
VTERTATGLGRLYLELNSHDQDPMPHRYELKRLTPEERRTHQEILAEQMEQQRWYVVVVLRDLVAEIAIPLN